MRDRLSRSPLLLAPGVYDALTIKQLERAGAGVIQLEDQVTPKRCGHLEGKALERAERHLEAGADVLFIEARRATEELELGKRCER